MTSRVLSVASPAVAQRIIDAPDLASAMIAEALLAYNLELALIDK